MDYGVRVLRFADYPVVPRRNGQGFTREVAASAVAMASTNREPDGEGLPPSPARTPAWRLSMATVEGDAAFSDFSGLVRTLGVVDGDGIELTVDGRVSRLHRGETYGPFAGGVPASARALVTSGCALGASDRVLAESGLALGASALDLGLIVDPARARAELSTMAVGERDIVGLIWFVISLVDGLDVSLNGIPAATLACCDTAALDLRTAPIARLSLDVADSAPATVAYLVSIAT